VAALGSYPITEDRKGESKNNDRRKRHPHPGPEGFAHLPGLSHAERNVLFQIPFPAFLTIRHYFFVRVHLWPHFRKFSIEPVPEVVLRVPESLPRCQTQACVYPVPGVGRTIPLNDSSARKSPRSTAVLGVFGVCLGPKFVLFMRKG
jgi:hypothetical protein